MDSIKILVRTPNWLGDLVMSEGFFKKLNQFIPTAEITVVTKYGLGEIAKRLSGVSHVRTFSKSEANNLYSLYKFAKADTTHYDYYFSLPDSFSAAWFGFCTNTKNRIGYRSDWRSLMLTTAIEKPSGLHRVEEYAWLLKPFINNPIENLDTKLSTSNLFLRNEKDVVININSEAQSRRMSFEKWALIADRLIEEFGLNIILIGSNKESSRVQELYDKIKSRSKVKNLAGITSLNQLIDLLQSSRLLLTSDSGPAHLSNAVGTKTIVLFGAGDEKKTAPYIIKNDQGQIVLMKLRVEGLECAPCVSNICKFTETKCLEQFEVAIVVDAVKKML